MKNGVSNAIGKGSCKQKWEQTRQNDLHLSRVDQRHVGKGRHVAMAAESDGENCLHVGLIETGESSSGIRRFHLRHGHVPVNQMNP